MNVSTDSGRFETLNTFFHDRFNVWLVEQTASIIPIWLPVIERGDWISPSPKAQVYCFVESGNDAPKVFTYSGHDVYDIPVKTDANENKSVKLNVYSTDPVMVSVDRKYTGREIGIRKGSLPIVTTNHTIEFLVDGVAIVLDKPVDYESISRGITVQSNTKFTLLQKSKKHIYRTIAVDQPSVSVDVPNDTEELIVAYGRMGAGFIPFESVHIAYPQKNIIFDETVIITQIQSHSIGTMVAAPIWVREIISYCSKHKYHKIQQVITSSICNGNIRKGLVIYLN